VYHQKLIKSGTAIPATNIGGQYGQINSFYPDLSLGISQTLNFPTVYSRQKNLLTEEWKSSILNLKIKETELKKSVTEVYFNLLYLQQKRKLLLENDSLFSEFLSKSILRFKKGESNILEKTTAENQQGHIALQLSQLEQDWEILQLQFQYLLNTSTVFVPAESDFFSQNIPLLEKSEFVSHPLIQYWKQQQNIAVANTKVEKSKLLPDITFGYNIMGMKGMGANDIEYNSNLRFHSVHIGLGIPIFNGSQKSKINASKINEQIAANEYEINFKNHEKNFAQVMKQYQKYQDAVLYFEKTALENATTLKITAYKQFINGEINYLEWVLLMNQAISIQSDYIEAVRNRNNAVAEINFYHNK
jgi:cobalt-zinc-cadmium resistance protein CzcA